MDSCEKISNSITAAKELIENETRSLAAFIKQNSLKKSFINPASCFVFLQ